MSTSKQLRDLAKAVHTLLSEIQWIGDDLPVDVEAFHDGRSHRVTCPRCGATGNINGDERLKHADECGIAYLIKACSELQQWR